MKKHVVVIGGGMAGTAAAHALVDRGHNVTVIEKNNRLGGRVHTIIEDGNAIEMGAGFITNAYSNIHAFLRASDLNGQLTRQRGRSGILRGNSIKMATLSTFAGTDVLSWGAKRQALSLLIKIMRSWPQLDMHAPWRAAGYDTRSVANMFNGTAEEEFLEYVLQPILNGYFYWTPERTSEAMLLIIGKALIMGGTYKIQGGLQQIPERATAHCRVLLGHTVKSVERRQDGKHRITAEHHGKIHELQADGIVCATTASAIPRIIPTLDDHQKEFFSSINYSSTAVVAKTYKRSAVYGDQGLAFPRKGGSSLAAITVSPGRGNYSTLKMYASGASATLLSASDEEISSKLDSEMNPVRRAVLYDNAISSSTHVQRWEEALPLFEPGHFIKLQTFNKGGIERPDQLIVFAGDYLGGPFMEGAFTSGMQAAKRLDLSFNAKHIK